MDTQEERNGAYRMFNFFNSAEKSAVYYQRESLIIVIIQFSELFGKVWMYSKEIVANPMEISLKRWFDHRSFTTERFLKIIGGTAYHLVRMIHSTISCGWQRSSLWLVAEGSAPPLYIGTYPAAVPWSCDTVLLWASENAPYVVAHILLQVLREHKTILLQNWVSICGASMGWTVYFLRQGSAGRRRREGIPVRSQGEPPAQPHCSPSPQGQSWP